MLQHFVVGIDETGILICSEVGRFPIINKLNGKDHFPVVSAMLLGPGLQPGTFGGTDNLMSTMLISKKTGLPSRDATELTLDDLGRTLAAWYGLDAQESTNFHGDVLDFLFA